MKLYGKTSGTPCNAKVVDSPPPRNRLINSFLFNLSGQGIPLLAALYSIPLLIDALGTDRFGILTLIWVVVGYFGLFDLGIGRAMTKLVAERFTSERSGEISGIFWTGIPIVLMSGIVGSCVIFTTSPWLVEYALKAPSELQAEALPAFYLLAFSIPLVISVAGLTGFLEASRRFGLTNLVRIPAGTFSFIGPLLVLPYTHNLYALTAVMLAGRVAEFVALFIICLGVSPSLRHKIKFSTGHIRPLLSFGGWVTVSSIVGPILTYLDRFLISALLSVSAIAYYATPYSIIIKLLIIPSALVGVLFPTFVLHLLEDRSHAASIFYRSTNYILFSLFPLALIVFTFAHEGLTLWVNETFADHSSVVLQWLVIGVFMNGLAQLPVALVHGNGRPELVAKLHLAELPFYLFAVIWLLKQYGIVGVAIAGVGRIAVDTFVLFMFAKHLVPETGFAIKRTFNFIAIAMVVFLIAGNIALTHIKILYCLTVLALFMLWIWCVLDAEERKILIRFTKIRPRK